MSTNRASFSRGDVRLLYEPIYRDVEATPSVGEEIGGVGSEIGIETSEAGAQDAGVGLGEEQSDTTAYGGEDVAVLGRQALDQDLQAQAAEIVGHAYRRG